MLFSYNMASGRNKFIPHNSLQLGIEPNIRHYITVVAMDIVDKFRLKGQKVSINQGIYCEHLSFIFDNSFK